MTKLLKLLPPSEGADWCRVEARATSDSGESSADVYIYDEIGYWGTNAKAFAAELADLDVDLIRLGRRGDHELPAQAPRPRGGHGRRSRGVGRVADLHGR